ncbi:MAG: hypothetical protein AAF628_30015 [Planctomycetota bacterium]
MGGSRGETGSFFLNLIGPPVNDECGGAIPVRLGAVPGSNVGATRSPVTGSCLSMDHDVWFVLQAPFTGAFTASLCPAQGGDLVVANFGGANRIYANLRRQTVAPLLARGGGDFSLEVCGRGGASGPMDFAVPLVSPGLGRLPLPPWGVLGLDPAQLIALPPTAVPPLTGVGTVSVRIPTLAGLRGVDLFAQALLVLGTRPRFTNVTAEMILR